MHCLITSSATALNMFPRILEIPLPFEVLGAETLTIYSFGAMMALAFLSAAWLSRRELDRMYKAGYLTSVALPASKGKVRGRRKTAYVSPSHLIGTVVVIAVVGGLAGAKVFHILENMEDFRTNPAGMIFSKGGLTFYGGLLVAGFGIVWYVRKKGVKLATFCDALIPNVLLAYGIGRIGCHLAGDGDWGIAADPAARPSFVPVWLWGETYPNNILGLTLPETGVYPTSLYEFGMALILFGILYGLRKHPFKWGWIFSLTMVFFGAERLLIEQIRVTARSEIFGLEVSQAMLISSVMIVLGVIGLVRTTRRREKEVSVS